MTNITQCEEEIRQAGEVKKLKNSFLDAFFEEKEQQIFQFIKELPLGSTEDLSEAHHQLKALNALMVQIQSVMDSGKMSQMMLDADNN